MGITATVETKFGEERECYIRLNNIEVSNHGVESTALFRAFLTKEAFKKGSHFVAEFEVTFSPDVSLPLWGQAYAALVKQEKLPDTED